MPDDGRLNDLVTTSHQRNLQFSQLIAVIAAAFPLSSETALTASAGTADLPTDAAGFVGNPMGFLAVTLFDDSIIKIPFYGVDESAVTLVTRLEDGEPQSVAMAGYLPYPTRSNNILDPRYPFQSDVVQAYMGAAGVDMAGNGDAAVWHSGTQAFVSGLTASRIVTRIYKRKFSTGTTTLVSQTAANAPNTGACYDPCLTADDRYCAFNCVPIGAHQAFTQTGSTTNLSALVQNLSNTGKLYVGQGVSGSGIPVATTITSLEDGPPDTSIIISNAATATANDVVLTFAAITNADAFGAFPFFAQAFVKDTVGGGLYCVTNSTLGGTGCQTGSSTQPIIRSDSDASDGAVSVATNAADLAVAKVTSNTDAVHIGWTDLTNPATYTATLASVNNGGTPQNANVLTSWVVPGASAGDDRVVFDTAATNMGVGTTLDQYQVYMRTLFGAPGTILVSRDPNTGNPITNPAQGAGFPTNTAVGASSDGTAVCWEVRSPSYQGNDHAGDIVVATLSGGAVISIANVSSGCRSASNNQDPAISPNGRYVAWESSYEVPGVGFFFELYRYDRQTSTLDLLTAEPNGDYPPTTARYVPIYNDPGFTSIVMSLGSAPRVADDGSVFAQGNGYLGIPGTGPTESGFGIWNGFLMGNP